MKKKVNILGKSVPVFVLVLLGIGLVSAALVSYLATPITGSVVVKSPMTLTVTSSIPEGICTENVCDVTLHGGESFSIDANLKNDADVNSLPMLTEISVPNFDGLGITVTHVNAGVSYDIPFCVKEGTTYYYIGPSEGFVFTAGYEEPSTTTITTAPNLAPKSYSFTTGVILKETRACIPE